MSSAELSVWGVHQGEEHPCVMETAESTDQFIICEIQTKEQTEFKELKVTAWNALRKVSEPVTW